MAKRTEARTSRTAKSTGTKRKKQDMTFEVDFTKETSSGGQKRFPEGDYHFKIVKLQRGLSKEKETPYVQLGLEFQDGKRKGDVWDGMRTRVYVTDNNLWRIRSLFEACELTVPKKKARIDFNDLMGQELGITVIDGEAYKGRIPSEMGDFITVDTIGGGDVDDDDEDEDEDDDDEDDDDDEEDLEDEDEL